MAREHEGWGIVRCPALFAVLLATALLRAAPAIAAGVVGTGTPGSCTEAALDAALAGGGSVTFDCGPDPVTVTITSTKMIGADTSIDGGSSITISGGNSVRVFSVNDIDSSFTVQNLTIANGKGDLWGGGIANAGTLTVTNSTFSGNSAHSGGAILSSFFSHLTVINSTFSGNSADPVDGAGGAIFSTCFPCRGGAGAALEVTDSTFSGNSAGRGGGIFNSGSITLTVSNSTFSGNSAVGGGGGIANVGTLMVSNSTFSGNSAGDGGGGIHNVQGALTVSNSTFSGNSALDFGAGIHNGLGTLTVSNSTFSGNSTADGNGGGIYNESGTVTVANTIVANGPGGNCFGVAIIDGGHNIDDGATCGFTGTGCVTTSGGSFCNTNPQLDPAGLASNGGPTQTIALEPDSPAIDAGDPEVCAHQPVNGIDQRGFIRPGTAHTACSSGAYEPDAVPPAASCTGDCNGNGMVVINELILGVSIALGAAPDTACPAFANADGRVDIAQLIQGVNNGLGGCSLG